MWNFFVGGARPRILRTVWQRSCVREKPGVCERWWTMARGRKYLLV